MADESRCIYCQGRVVRSSHGAWTPATGVDGCACPNVKKAEREGGTLVHWARRAQSIFSMCSDPDTHAETAHLIAVEPNPLPDDAKVTCLDCLALHVG